MNFRNLIPIVVAGAWMASTVSTGAELKAFKRKYRYYLDPTRAEEILGGLSLLPRATKDEWLKKLGNKRYTTYKVRGGDSLWVISKNSLGDAWLWRKLWQENPELMNPHELAVGQQLSYYREDLEIQPLYIPLIRLTPSQGGGLMDLDNDSFAGAEVANQLRIPFIIVDEDEVLGEVTGAFTRASNVNNEDEVYISIDEMESAKVGDRFSIVRFEREVKDTATSTKRYLGRLMKVVGGVTVIQKGEDLVKARLTEQIYPISRGDKLIAYRDYVKLRAFLNPPDDLRLRILPSEYTDVKMFGEGHLVLLNQGGEDGVQPGQMFRVARDTDPYTDSDADVEPDYKGEINIVLISKYASIGYVAKSKEPLIVGDTLLAAQLFQNPAPLPRREAQTLLLE